MPATFCKWHTWLKVLVNSYKRKKLKKPPRTNTHNALIAFFLTGVQTTLKRQNLDIYNFGQAVNYCVIAASNSTVLHWELCSFHRKEVLWTCLLCFSGQTIYLHVCTGELFWIDELTKLQNQANRRIPLQAPKQPIAEGSLTLIGHTANKTELVIKPRRRHSPYSPVIIAKMFSLRTLKPPSGRDNEMQISEERCSTL